MSRVTDRLTDRVTRARLKLELRRGARPAGVALVGIAIGLLCFVFIASNASNTLLRDTYEARFAVNDASGVVAGRQEVRIKGIPAGTISAVDISDGQAVLTARLQSSFGPIYRDATAVLRPNTALEDMYLDIVDRGDPGAGELKGQTPLEEDRTEASVHVEDVLDAFRPGVRQRLRALLGDLGNGLDERGDALGAAFAEFVPLLQVAGRMSRQLAERADATKRLVHNSAVLTSELRRRDRQLRRLVESGGIALRTLQEGSGDLDATLAELPGTLAAIDLSFEAVRGVLGDVDAAVLDLAPVADGLPGALAGLRRLSADARPAVGELQEPVRRLVPLARSLLPVSRSLSGAAGWLDPQVGSVDRVVAAVADCERPIQGFMQWNPSLAKFGDAWGPFPRGNLLVNLNAGLTSDPNTYFHQSCTPGRTLGGRPVRPEDQR